jgi:HD-GYP domain-containing protein (c-di-GMP phosphodiesterase class II)
LTLLRAGYHFCNVDSLERMLQSILDDTVAVLNAQRGSIVLKDEKTSELLAKAVSAPRPRLLGGARSFSKTLAERCFNSGESLLCRDVKTDTELQDARSVKQGTMASIICALLRSPRRRLGVLHLDRGPTQPPFTPEDFYLADAIAANVSVAIETAQMVERQREEFVASMAALMRLLEIRVPYLTGQAPRVVTLALFLGEELHLTPIETQQLKISADLHDIGNLSVADAILNKPGPLSPAEWEQVRQHPVRGAAHLESMPFLASILPIIRSHHERWDGNGYPDRLAGDRIPRLSRIIGAAQAFAAMISARPYRPALSVDAAFAEIAQQAGKQFDPEIAEVFQYQRSRIESLLGLAQPAAHAVV